ncbi:hypothetical protein F5Y09DRAFT_305102 [Xylaria sp. FL1042]|nr:hypothetical protein F5Y09DRAFT_305102 [Xylaria sp. FL1042]
MLCWRSVACSAFLPRVNALPRNSQTASRLLAQDENKHHHDARALSSRLEPDRGNESRAQTPCSEQRSHPPVSSKDIPLSFSYYNSKT